MNANGIFDLGLDRREANYQSMTPVMFLDHAALIHGDRTAVVYDDIRYSYREFRLRCRLLASSLSQLGVGIGDTVSVIAPNIPAMLEAHFGVPMVGAVLNTINVRLDHQAVSFILAHGEAKVLLVDVEYLPLAKKALSALRSRPIVIVIVDPSVIKEGSLDGFLDYEQLLVTGDPEFQWAPPEDEWQAICLNYTSGTTGNPKGVVYHSRGAYLNTLGNAIVFGLPPGSVYLWTLPMFHCNGWLYPWVGTLFGATHVCMRRINPSEVFDIIAKEGVTHMCGAPIVLNMLASEANVRGIRLANEVAFGTGGAPPPSSTIARAEAVGFRVTHFYGMTELYGNATHCFMQPHWEDLSEDERRRLMIRQGVPYPTIGELRIAVPETCEAVPSDGKTLGELIIRGNTVMKGYLKNSAATEETLGTGWLRTGDLGVVHPDGYVEIRDREKDIIISGGENISSLELEELFHRHPAVLEVAVVARQDDVWGESPCAFIALKPGVAVSDSDLIAWCRRHISHYKVPKTVIFCDLPKTATGKILKYELRQRADALARSPVT